MGHAPLVPPGAVGAEEARALAEGAVLVRHDDESRVRLTGHGRVQCLQGLVTCDVDKPGDGSQLFGALLTNKGMIVAPLWITRLQDSILVALPGEAAAGIHEVMVRSLPPRLCRHEEVTGTTIGLGLHGPRAGEVLAQLVGPVPEGGAATSPYANDRVVVAASTARGAPGYDVVVSVALARALTDDLLSSGATSGSAALRERSRIIAGIPRLGAEIDERTLPQEARLEDLGAISYTKGCYLGQETVARVHFRGHANRRLAALALDTAPATLPLELALGGKPVGRLTSAAWTGERGGWVGLGVIRREVESGAALAVAGGGIATVRSWSDAA